MKAIVKFKKIHRSNKKKKWDVEKLKSRQKIFQEQIEEEVEKFSQCDKSVNERWEILKEVIKESAEKNIGYRRGTKAKKPWVTAEMISKMEERRKFKNARSDEGKQMYRKLDNELRRETDRAREEW